MAHISWGQRISERQRRCSLALLVLVLFGALIAILTSSSRQAAHQRNLKRQNDLVFLGGIINAYQTAFQRLPGGITAERQPICHLQDLSMCGGAFILPMPFSAQFVTSTAWLGDPKTGSALNLGYDIVLTTTTKAGYAISAPAAELGLKIQYPK